MCLQRVMRVVRQTNLLVGLACPISWVQRINQGRHEFGEVAEKTARDRTHLRNDGGD